MAPGRSHPHSRREGSRTGRTGLARKRADCVPIVRGSGGLRRSVRGLRIYGVQIYDSFTRRKEELPAPPARSGCTSAGRRSTSASTSATRGPYVVFLWMRNWLREQGYEATLVENITDVNDKIYDAARAEGIPSAELAERATRWYFEDTDGLGIGRPDVEPLATETIPEIVALIEELVERGLAYESQGDVYFRVARFPEYGALSGANLDDMVAAGARRPEGGSPRLRALEGEQAARGHGVGLAVGPRPPRLAHRVLRDGGEASGPGVRAARRRARPPLPAPRERDRPVARRRPAVRAHLGAQRHARVRRREDGQVGRQHRLAPRGARPLGPRGDPAPLPRRALPQPGRLLRGRDRAGEGAVGGLPHGLSRRGRRAATRRPGTTSPPRSTTTSTRPRRSRSSTSGARPAGSRSSPAAWRSSGSRPAPRQARRPRRSSARRGARARAGRARLRRGRPPARRDRRRRLGGAGRGRTASA